MIKNKMALLGVAATVGVMGGAFVSPAQAISLSAGVGQTLTAGGLTLTLGSFSATGATANIGAWGDFDATFELIDGTYVFDIGAENQLGSGDAGTYTQQYSVTPVPGSLFITTFNAFNTSGTTELWTGGFDGTPVDNLVVPESTFPAFPVSGTLYVRNTYTLSSAPGSLLSSATNQLVPVPWETDALSVIGVTTLFGFGVWNKRKRKVDLSK
jgi:hypothetical protein